MFSGGEARVYVDGKDLYEEFGVVFTDESDLRPPEKRTVYKEIPGMDGDLDLTEVQTDDMVFGRRTDVIVLGVPEELDFEVVKTRVSNFLDGRRYDYSFSFDPGYTRNGRFRVTEYPGWRGHRIQIEVDADPWKRGGHVCKVVRGAGGMQVVVENARRHVQPTFTVQQQTLVEYKGRAWITPDEPGSYVLDLRLDEGISSLYIVAAPDYCNTTWDDLAAKYPTWDDIPKGTRWADVYTLMGDPDPEALVDVQIDYDLYDL